MSGLLPSPHVADGAAEEAETQAEHRHVAEIESSLEESIHLCFEEEVVKGVEVDISRSGACREEGRPLPPAGAFPPVDPSGNLRTIINITITHELKAELFETAN